MRRRGWILVCCLFTFATEAAQNPEFNVRLWQAEDGLPHNIVQAITQTRDGYLWVGTREGLSRFDGERFQMVSLVAGNLQPSVLQLLEAGDGSLWVGTEKMGLFRLHEGTIERCAMPEGTLDYDAFEIRESADGSIWLQSRRQILSFRDGKMTRRARFRYEQQPFCVDTAGQVWLYDERPRSMGGKTDGREALIAGALPRAARSLYCEREGVFWIGDAEGGLVELKDGTATKFSKAEGPAGFVSVIFRDSAGNLWIGSYSGLSRFVNGEFVNFQPSDEPSYRIFAIYEDCEKNLWVGSEEGLARLTPRKFKTITKKDGLSLNTVVTVCPSRDGSVWISSWGGGLNHWRDGKITWLSKSNGLSSDFIMAMTEARDGALWAGADYGGALNCIRGGQITTYGSAQGFSISSGGANTALYEDTNGLLWIGTRESLQCWNGKQFSRIPKLNGKVNALCGGPEGAVWIGTDDGLWQWRDGKLQRPSTDPRLRVAILTLFEDREHSFWLGTRSHGLLRWHGGTLAGFNSERGLFSDSIYSVLEDTRGNLWLNSSRGIFRVRKKQLEEAAAGNDQSIDCVTYGKADGILMSGQYQEETQPTACQSADGKLWFRTTQGVTVVDPDKISTNLRPPPVVIEQVLADRQPQRIASAKGELLDGLEVKPGRGELEIHYAALSFVAPEKNQFRYRLDGVDPNWVDAGTRRVAIYNHLSPGQYHFQVVACNNDGIWNETGAGIRLKLDPHFWQTRWFLAGILLGLVGMASGTARYVTRRRMQRRLEILERQNVLEKERARIARDMHDELGAKLTRISFQGATARRYLGQPAEAEPIIQKMTDTARELVLSLDQIVWAVDPKNDTLESLAAYICRYTSEFVENTPLQCEFLISQELPDYRLSTEARHNLFLAVKEILHNALKHSGASQITLRIGAGNGVFYISISDDGKGLPPETSGAPERFPRAKHGLANLRERLASIGGQLELRSATGRGLEVRLSLPLAKLGGDLSSIHTTRDPSG